MGLDEYVELTGVEVPDSRINLVTAQLERTRSRLETLLGFTLDPDQVQQNLYTELGKSPDDWSCSSVDTDNLQPPDAVVGAYRVFPYSWTDRFLPIDPASAVHAVKLVRGNVTMRTLEPTEYALVASKDGVTKYLQVICDWREWYHCPLQLAVDADWLWDEDAVPTELKQLWADMVTYYTDAKRYVKSESIGPHSYTRSEATKPEDEFSSLLRRYAGPWGSINRTLVA